ncbi:3-oxoadipyl-CoA thiolase [Marivirga atlantica]|jgi:acetyl-CoA C-acetyltransferase|uniref:Acetyl-CoA C-acyltransferase n=1 Tax=Marivirga atlantica TaxID=1548457 RepID=A0A937APS8_9BACT|nr:acetyl-CoA C-acyltransferase [Marivirga atlantica]MBL0766587.1 acetyl-CoA C-acyltransferase [Marivirga atlantica]
MSQAAYIIDIVRTPVGKFGGTLSSVRPDDLAAHIIKALIERNPQLDLSEVEDIIFGAANQAGEDNRNVARMAGLMAGLPIETAGLTVNRLCASGLQAIMDASRATMLNEGGAYIAGGVESMTRAPFVMAKAETPFSRNAEIYDTTIGWRFPNPKLSAMHYPFAMGETAENVAEKWKISREEQDEFAHGSQLKYDAAHKAGKFQSELISVSIPQRKTDDIVFDKDEHPRLSSVEKLASLKPAFKKDGTVTAGNASGVNDGSAAALVVSEATMKKYNLKPIARVVSMAVAGVTPDCMGIGPVPATQKALKRAGLKISDLDLIELNEAFASQSIACMRDLELNPEIVNVNGGSIAIGHPLGASGARISATLLHEMQKRENVKYGLATMCVGVGQGAAVIYEKL